MVGEGWGFLQPLLGPIELGGAERERPLITVRRNAFDSVGERLVVAALARWNEFDIEIGDEATGEMIETLDADLGWFGYGGYVEGASEWRKDLGDWCGCFVHANILQYVSSVCKWFIRKTIRPHPMTGIFRPHIGTP